MNLVQNHKCSFSIMGPHILKIKLCELNSSMRAVRSEIKFEVHHFLMRQKLKKPKKEESLPFGPYCAAMGFILFSFECLQNGQYN